MPGVASDSGGETSGGELVPISPEPQPAVVYPLRLGLGLRPTISRLSISWSRGNTLRVSAFRPPTAAEKPGDEVGGKLVEVRLSSGDGEISDAQWRRIAYGSVAPFALLQSRRNSVSSFSKMSFNQSPYHVEWWEYVMEYSKDINSLLGGSKLPPGSVIEDPKEVLKKVEEPTCLKAAWELMEIFYVDKLSQVWLPERLVDWLADYDSLLSGTQATVHSKLVNFQKELISLQVIEDDPRYWEVILSALTVGWLEIVVKMLRLHGSYQLDQLSNRETENGLVETVAVLIAKMPRLRPELEAGKLGECFKAKPDFIKAWEKWRAQITKLDCSTYWAQCAHHQTREGLRNMLQIMLGNTNSLRTATCNWMELYVSHFLYIRPFTVGLESMYSLAQKCIQLKPMSSPHRLMGLIIGILGENTEVVLVECSKGFGPWMVAHAIELLTTASDQAEILLHEERHNLGGISIEELHRLVYAQVVSSHALTWQALRFSSAKIEGRNNLKYKASKMELTITRPDDWHLHLRDGDLLEAVVSHSASHFGRGIVMPNLKPPITTTDAAMAYRESILKALPASSDFTPLMTLYLTDTTSPEEIKLARRSGVVFAVKLYPAGATTNSQDGVTDLFGKCLPVLEEMVEQNMPLLVHGEVTDPNVDVFDREKVFIDTVLQPLIQRLPQLKVVMEHITTMDAVRFVESCKEGFVAATVTPQHLLLNRNALFQGGLQPHNYCLPVLKREIHRQTIVSAVTSGNKRFFLGTDSAPHERQRKECPCGCAGIYNAPVALSLYAKVFEEAGALDKLEAFASFNGPDFYGLPRNTSKIKLTKMPWKVPESFSFSFGDIIPMFSGETLEWQSSFI